MKKYDIDYFKYHIQRKIFNIITTINSLFYENKHKQIRKNTFFFIAFIS